MKPIWRNEWIELSLLDAFNETIDVSFPWNHNVRVVIRKLRVLCQTWLSSNHPSLINIRCIIIKLNKSREIPYFLSSFGPDKYKSWKAVSWDPPTYSTPVKRFSICIFGGNFVILAQIHYKLLRRQAKLPRILSQKGQNDLECKGQCLLQSIPTESVPKEYRKTYSAYHCFMT